MEYNCQGETGKRLLDLFDAAASQWAQPFPDRVGRRPPSQRSALQSGVGSIPSRLCGKSGNVRP